MLKDRSLLSRSALTFSSLLLVQSSLLSSHSQRYLQEYCKYLPKSMTSSLVFEVLSCGWFVWHQTSPSPDSCTAPLCHPCYTPQWPCHQQTSECDTAQSCSRSVRCTDWREEGQAPSPGVLLCCWSHCQMSFPSAWHTVACQLDSWRSRQLGRGPSHPGQLPL